MDMDINKVEQHKHGKRLCIAQRALPPRHKCRGFSRNTKMKNIALLAALMVPYVCANAAGNFEFDIPKHAKDAPASKAVEPAASKANISVMKPRNVTVTPPAQAARVTAVIPVAPPKSAVVAVPPVEPTQPVVAATKPAVATGATKEIYRVEQVAKAAPKAGAKLCAPTTVAMTFHNVPTQKGPYFHRWVSLGCEADEVHFVREGNEQYSMHWQLAYVPADENQTARYALTWKVVGKDNQGAPVDYAARHTFTLDNARTLSLTNNMAVSLRKVP